MHLGNIPESHFFETDGSYIDIVIDQDIYGAMIDYLNPDAPFLHDCSAVKAGSKFVMPELLQSWGFGKRFEFIADEQWWIRYRVQLVHLIGHPDRVINTAEIQCSLYILFTLLVGYVPQSNQPTMQIGQVPNLSPVDQQGNSLIWGNFSPTALQIFLKDKDRAIQDITSVMMKAWNIMYPSNRVRDAWDFRAYYHNGYPGFVVPGDCACMGQHDPESNPDPEDGFDLSPHNLDHVVQQLTMLVAIAKLAQNLREMR